MIRQFRNMTLIDRIFGTRKGASEAPSSARVHQMVEPHLDTPRPARGMVYREGYIIYESGYRRKGIVLDYSNTGVRLRFPTNERLPNEVVLNAKAVGLEGPARVIWQEGSEVGLALIKR